MLYYENRKGSSNGLPVAYVAVNLEPSASYVAQTDGFINQHKFRIAVNDYGPGGTNTVRTLFFAQGTRPVFIIINGVSNSPSHALWQVITAEQGYGDSNFADNVAGWQRLIDSVQAPPPRITHVGLNDGRFEFTIPGQRGRTNRVECTTDFTVWTTITNVFGTNAPVVVRDLNPADGLGRFYRVVRP
jgi:hypothetical protein